MSSELKSAHIAPVVWVNPAEFKLCQTKPIIMNEHNELLNGMPRQIAALAARTDHCSLALMPATPPAAQVQGEQPMECSCPKIGEQWDPVEHGKDCPVHEPGARAALSAPTSSNMIDAYVVAREDLSIWKRRALEAEKQVRMLDQRIDQLVLDAQGETRMGEPYMAPPAAGVPEGWKLVPMEPTAQMTHVGQQLRYDAVNSIGHIYRTMLSAAPTPPTAEQQQAVVMPAAVLIQALENTRDIIDMQLDLVAARAKGSYLDKTPVMRSLRAHRTRCDEALTVYNRELLRLNPHLAKGEGV